MIRYSLTDLTTYQNELNNKCDTKKVEETIDAILKRLQYKIEKRPTAHSIQCCLFIESYDSDDVIDLSRYTAAELFMIKQYFEEKGFTVSYVYDNTFTTGSSDYIQGLKIKW